MTVEEIAMVVEESGHRPDIDGPLAYGDLPVRDALRDGVTERDIALARPINETLGEAA